MCELGPVSESKKVQKLHRTSILCNSRLVFFFSCLEPFSLKSISNNAGDMRLCLLNMSSVFVW